MKYSAWGRTASCLLAVAGSALAQQPPAEPAQIFDQPSVLTPAGQLVLEPSLQYTHSSSMQVAVEGYTVVPAVLVGLINISEVQRDTLTAAFALRYGLTRRLEAELRVPFVYKEESVRERELFKGSPTDLVRDSSGDGLGDVELALRYQLSYGGNGWPYTVVNLRVKSRTGEGPFEVAREELTVEDEDTGAPIPIGEIFREQPTGSGFWGVQAGLSFIYPTDPVALFGNVSYLWNVSRRVNAEYGRVDPGDAVSFGFGMGFAVNERMSFSLGYDHSVVFKTKYQHDPGLDAQFSRFQVGSLLFGLSHRVGTGNNVSLALAVGVTEYAPDIQLVLRSPFVLWGRQ